MASAGTNVKRAHARLAEYLAQHGLKQTRQREAIMQAFLSGEGHFTSEELYERVREVNPEIGAATVYRTLKLLCDADIANAIHLRDDVTLYERAQAHHDHLVCLSCGEIVEFECDVIEKRQLGIAEEHDYRLVRHRHHLFGYCRACQQKGLDSA